MGEIGGQFETEREVASRLRRLRGQADERVGPDRQQQLTMRAVRLPPSIRKARPALLCPRLRGTLKIPQEATTLTTPRTMIRNSRGPLAAIFLAVAMLTAAGCSSIPKIDQLPGLSEMRATSPDGQKCYDFCAHSQANCKFMCPKSIGICHDDCEIDSKICLFDCPDLERAPAGLY